MILLKLDSLLRSLFSSICIVVAVPEEDDGGGSRTTDLGDCEEEQLFFGEGVWKGNSWCSVQQRGQQFIQSELLQAFWLVILNILINEAFFSF